MFPNRENLRECFGGSVECHACIDSLCKTVSSVYDIWRAVREVERMGAQEKRPEPVFENVVKVVQASAPPGKAEESLGHVKVKEKSEPLVLKAMEQKPEPMGIPKDKIPEPTQQIKPEKVQVDDDNKPELKVLETKPDVQPKSIPVVNSARASSPGQDQAFKTSSSDLGPGLAIVEATAADQDQTTSFSDQGSGLVITEESTAGQDQTFRLSSSDQGPGVTFTGATPAGQGQTFSFSDASMSQGWATYHLYTSGTPLTSVACSDGVNGIMTRMSYSNLSPMFPYVTAYSKTTWNDPVLCLFLMMCRSVEGAWSYRTKGKACL